MLPVIIQGGMGVAVSDWRLARAVSSRGQLGVVSGTAIDAVMARRLQLGDPDGEIREALGAFPLPDVADRILDRYFIEGGKAPEDRFRASPMSKFPLTRRHEELLVAANFVEVWLARKGHANPVGINFLEKIQAPTLPSLYGAMLGGVDYVLMGAGIPRAIPGILDELAGGRPVEMAIDVAGVGRGEARMTFDPAPYLVDPLPQRPTFLAIVSSHVLATMLAVRTERPVDGFVIEYPVAGGHNAPPRTKSRFNARGEPEYGERDVPDLAVFRDLSLPFWLAGGFASPEGLVHAIAQGAVGIQAGTAFAYCAESGLREDLKSRVIAASRNSEVDVFTDPVASPTGFPFKVVTAGAAMDETRSRVCDLGYLRSAHADGDGSITWRCPAEPVDDFVRKGGDAADTVGRKCLCNALTANIGLGQIRPGGRVEPPVITSGDAVHTVAEFLAPGADTYTAADVIDRLLGKLSPALSPHQDSAVHDSAAHDSAVQDRAVTVHSS